ncbi:MAG: ComEC/Rec2 family competence protein [Blautia sp.]|nr:ComEC/Rec2 family competence protein [Blautia sp.]
MLKRPLCAVCLVLFISLCVLDAAGLPLIRGIPLPADVQNYIKDHPQSTVYGEALSCSQTEKGTTLILKNAHLVLSGQETLSSFPSGRNHPSLKKIIPADPLSSGSNLSYALPLHDLRVFLSENTRIRPGSFVLLSGRLEETQLPRNPGEFDSRQYYACDRIWYFLKKASLLQATASHQPLLQLLADVRQQFQDCLSTAAGETAPVFCAIVLGDKSSLSDEIRLRYQLAGILHLLAISGLHISVLGMGLFHLLKKAGLGNWPASLICLCLIFSYGIMTGASLSTLRALSMFLISTGARILGRIYDLLSALALSAILLILEAPACLYSASFLLSFSAVLGIAGAGPVFLRAFRQSEPWLAFPLCRGRFWQLFCQKPAGKRVCRLLKGFCEALISSLSVFLTTLPVLLYFYGEVSLTGLFLNLLILPSAGLVLGSGILTCIVGTLLEAFSPALGHSAAFFCALPGRGLLKLYEILCYQLAGLPFSSWIVGQPGLIPILVYCFLLLFSLSLLSRAFPANPFLSRQKREGPRTLRVLLWDNLPLFLLLTALLILCVRPRLYLSITCVDVGQGDGIVIQTPRGKAYLIDGGSTSKQKLAQYQLLPFLKNQGISHLDGILISHTDEDHYSGVKDLLLMIRDRLSSVSVNTLYLPDWPCHPPAWEELAGLAADCGIPVQPLCAGCRLSGRDISFQVLAPLSGAEGKDVNEDGMVLELKYRDFRALFTGDIGEETELKLLPFLENMDFLKVGHHGSKGSSSPLFLERIRPRLGVISCSPNNRYGHPSPEAVLRLQEAGCQLEYTMNSGAVTILTDGRKIWVRRFLS